MKFEYNGEGTLIIDDGAFVISQLMNGNYYLGVGEGLEAVEAGGKLAGLVPQDNETPEPAYDPYPYISSYRYLSIDDSTERALNRVYHEIWGDFASAQVGDVNMLRASIRDMIVSAMGRQAVYALAGGIKKGLQQGKYAGVPLAYVFKGFVDGHIVSEQTQQEQGSWSLSRSY